MPVHGASTPQTGQRTLLSRVRSSALWKTPRSPRAFIVSAELLCVTWLILAILGTRADSADLGRFLLLFGLSALYAEGGDRIERLRRYTGYVENSAIVEGSSQWCLAAALVLPPGLAGALVALIYVHYLLRAKRHQANRPYRVIYSGTTAVLATMLSATVLAAVNSALGQSAGSLGVTFASAVAVLAAFTTYAVVQETLMVAVLWLIRRPVPLRAVVGGPTERAMELATLALGVLLAVTVLHAPYLSPIVMLVVVVLRRSALVHELQQQATRDAKTGLLNAGAWRQEAERELIRAERIDTPISVLMVDLDHFKALNDAYGHQAGDGALKAVADCISDALRGYDAVGRFGGEEFAALLGDADAARAEKVAARLCERIRDLRTPHGGTVTASVGVGVGRSGHHSLDDLISVADQALYVAKNAGRDRVHTMHAVLDPARPHHVVDS
jgi:diguanylate cyclase (GGDEF)-like protein